ncbi:MAG: acyl-CoA dehydrogenase family protein, partial [Ilumatobacteraceae bacterium]
MRAIFDETHEAFRESVASFIAKEMVPHYPDWEAAGIAPREIFTAVGANGFLGYQIPEEFGGSASGSEDDYMAMVIATEELSTASLGAGGSLIT